VVGEVEETRFHILKLRMTSTITTRRGETGLQVRDEILNLSQSPAEVQMLYHVNFGIPLLDAGSRLVVPLKTLVPRNPRAAEGLRNWDSYVAEEPGYEEQVYFMHLQSAADGRTRALLKNAHGTRGASLVFNTGQLPCFTLWKNTTAVADGYVTGLEPGTNFPNPRSHEGRQGRVVTLPPGGRCVFEVALEVHGSSTEVSRAADAVSTLQGAVEPTIYREPQPGWCA
jgi:hypothetical protein